MEEINKDELKQKLDSDSDIALIEVLDHNEYKKGHIQGAINIPLAKIVSEAKKLFDKDRELILYCSDYECSASPTAGKKLENAGFDNVYHYPGGKKEWKEAGYPMET